jgi:hypothetical protein
MCALADLFTPGLCISIICPELKILNTIPWLLVATKDKQNIPNGWAGHATAIFFPKARLNTHNGQPLSIHPPQKYSSFLPVLAIDGTVLAPTVTPVFECKSLRDLPPNLRNTRIYQRRLTYQGKPENIKFVRSIFISNMALQHPDTGVVHEYLPCRQKADGLREREAGIYMSDIFDLNHVHDTPDFSELIFLDCSPEQSNEDSCLLPSPGLPDWVPKKKQKKHITELTKKFAKKQKCLVTHDIMDEFYCNADGLTDTHYGALSKHMKRSKNTCPDCIQIRTCKMPCTRTHNTAHILVVKKKTVRSKKTNK